MVIANRTGPSGGPHQTRRTRRNYRKLSFSQTMLFVKFARPMMRPLYRKLYARQYAALLGKSDRRVLTRWIKTLQTLGPKIIRGFGKSARFRALHGRLRNRGRNGSGPFRDQNRKSRQVNQMGKGAFPRFSGKEIPK